MSSSNQRTKKGKHKAVTNSGNKTKVEPSPSGRRKLDFPGSASKANKATDVERPLKGKVFHLNVKRPQFARRLKEDLEYLGGTVDPFLNADVWYLITDNIEAKQSGSSKGANQAGPASPAVSTPSPFYHTKGSIGNADSPSVSTNQESGPVTRGKAILQKAVNVKSQGGGSSVLETARNLRIHIYHVDAIRKYLDKSKERLQQQLQTHKSKGHASTPKDSSTPSTSREKRLTRPYLKYEDASRHYRPISKEFTSVPRVMVDTARGSCPFDLHPHRKENKEQRAERNCDEGAAGDMPPPKSVKKAIGSQKTPSNKAGHSSRKQGETTGVKEKRRGYCECCALKYDDLEKHLQSKQHIEFVSKQNNYVNLDRMISEGPNIDKFLEDVMKYHEEDSIKGQEIQHELNEVLLVSSPVTKQPEPAKSDKPSTSKPPPPVFAIPMSPPMSPSKRVRNKAAPPSPGQSPRTNKLSLRQRTSPRLLDGGPKSPDVPPSTPRTELSSTCTFDKPPGRESRIVPKRPPTSIASSSMVAGKSNKLSRPGSPRAARGRPVSHSTAKEAIVSQSTAKEANVSQSTAKEANVSQSTAKEATVSQSTAKEASKQTMGKQAETKDKTSAEHAVRTDTVDKEEAAQVAGESSREQDTSRRKTRRSLDPAETNAKESKIEETASAADEERTSHKKDDIAQVNQEQSGASEKKRKRSQTHSNASSDDNVFEPDTRRFRTPGRKPGNFTKASDSDKLRTKRPDNMSGSGVEDNELSSPRGRSRRSRRHDDGTASDSQVLVRPSRKRKQEDVLEGGVTKRQRFVEEKESLRNLRTKADDHTGGSPRKSPKSSDDFRDEMQVRRSGRGCSKPNYAKQVLLSKKEKELVRQGKTEQQQAIVSRLNRSQKQDEALSEQKLRRSNRNTTLTIQDIDKVIREKMDNKTTSVASNKNSTLSSTAVQPPSSGGGVQLPSNGGVQPTTSVGPFTTIEEEQPLHSESYLPSMFRSDSSMDPHFLGFRREDIAKTDENLCNLSATDEKLKLEQAGLNMYCIPSSDFAELAENKSESSDSSVDLADVSKVLQSLENFASEGSEWEAPVTRFFDNFDEVVEDLKRRTSELQALTPKSHRLQADDAEEDYSLKENLQQEDAGNQQMLSSEGNIADGFADVPSTAAVDDTLTRRRSARIQDKESVCGDDDKASTSTVPYTKTSRKTGPTQKDSGIFKAPFPSPKKKCSKSQAKEKFVTSTPVCGGSGTEQGSPCISLPVEMEDKDKTLFMENYVHDEMEPEVIFPKFSSPNKPGMLVSPVKYVMLGNNEIASPARTRRKSNLSMSKEGFAYDISPSGKPEVRKSLFKLKRSTSLNIPGASSPGSHQLPSPTPPSDCDTVSNMNRSLSTPISMSSLNRSPSFTYLTDGQSKKRIGSFSLNSKKPNFSSSILKPAKKGLNTKRLGRKQQQSKVAGGKNKKRVKSKGAKRHIFSDADADEDVYEFVDEGKDESEKNSSQESPPGSKKNMVSVSIQTNEADLQSDGTMKVTVPPSPVKQHLSPVKNSSPRKSETVLLASFNPVVNLEKSVLPLTYWMH